MPIKLRVRNYVSAAWRLHNIYWLGDGSLKPHDNIFYSLEFILGKIYVFTLLSGCKLKKKHRILCNDRKWEADMAQTNWYYVFPFVSAYYQTCSKS